MWNASSPFDPCRCGVIYQIILLNQIRRRKLGLALPALVYNLNVTASLFSTMVRSSYSPIGWSLMDVGRGCLPIRTVSRGESSHSRAVLGKCFAKNPHQRHPDRAHFSHIADESVYSYPPEGCQFPSLLLRVSWSGSCQIPNPAVKTPSQANAHIERRGGGMESSVGIAERVWEHTRVIWQSNDERVI